MTLMTLITLNPPIIIYLNSFHLKPTFFFILLVTKGSVIGVTSSWGLKKNDWKGFEDDLRKEKMMVKKKL